MASNLLTSKDIQLFTIGHGTLPAERLLKLLEENKICCLVDIRSKPYSRRASQFNRNRLEAVLKNHGIDYLFGGAALGGYPDDASVYPGGVVQFGQQVDYQAVMTKDWYQRGIERLMALAAECPAAIMCAEENPADCHRQQLVSQTLLAKGVKVLHIRHDASLQPAWRNQPTLLD